TKRLSMRWPKTWTIRCLGLAGGRLNTSEELLWKRKPTDGWTRATRWNSSMIWRSSTGSDFRKFRLAGILKKRFLTEMEVPLGVATGDWETTLLPSTLICTPTSISWVRVCISTWAMAAIEARASPRKPLVLSWNRSWAEEILEVAWR